MSAYDPIVLASRQVLLQRLGDYVRTGHVNWTCGEVTLERAPSLAGKFARLYGTDLDRNRRLRAKARGEGNAVLLLARLRSDDARLLWYLLVSAGDNPAHQLEHLRDASTRDGRMRHAGYELVHVAKAGANHPVLTWRMTRESEDGWRNRALAEARRGNNHQVQMFLEALYRSPGFYGVRKQVGKTVSLFRREWRRRRGAIPTPALPRLYYCARLPNRGTRLSRVADALPPVDHLASGAKRADEWDADALVPRYPS